MVVDSFVKVFISYLHNAARRDQWNKYLFLVDMADMKQFSTRFSPGINKFSNLQIYIINKLTN